MIATRTVADFFAGIGLVTLGLQRQGWETVYAVDYSPEKRQLYEGHFGVDHYFLQDVHLVAGACVPKVTLAHASFPCTDLSVAGSRGGIQKGESSAFWEFARILREMSNADGPGLPPMVLVENVEGLLTAGGGKDLISVLETLNEIGYSVDILLIDAAKFVPQSRVRLFVVGSQPVQKHDRLELEKRLVRSSDARPNKIRDFIRAHPEITWNIRDLPNLPIPSVHIEDIIETDAEWWEHSRSDYLFRQMFGRHQEIVRRMMALDKWSYGTVFRRMRMRDGQKQSTAELRTDGIAGCLRTPKGGSARQILVRAGYGRFDARLLTARENARLMGADDFKLPPDINLNDALFGFGDAVCVPVIEWIAQHYLNPLLDDYAKDRLRESSRTGAVELVRNS